MNTFVVEYTYPADSSVITEVRPRHREFLAGLKEKGHLIGSGPYTDGDGGALIVIRLPEPASLDDARELMDQDPFHTEGALTARFFHTWNPVLNVFGD
ncbi:YciI family protein [Corynebacterium sp. P7003]|uniref:YciI family protein n=1 Tax=Corynebacterium pygosceleis TaxID=2800406 RepID=A0ABT3WP28_9CORY|nr:YciI family protein [Corynebacterium pygosceleis]MCX7443936.1 YciI family protein [Corynebacterium pygosceleis]